MSTRLASALFVLIWSTGWIVAKIVTPHVDPLTFLCLRYVAAIAALVPLAAVMGARWPTGRGQWTAALANGVMLHGMYLGGIWWAIAHGVPAGISALIAVLQPLLTALAAGPLVGERLGPRRWLGVALGFVGVVAIVAPKLQGATLGELGLPIAVNVVAMVAVTAATLHQKRWLQGADLRTLAPIQYLGALAVTLPAALLLEDLRFEVTPETIGVLAWSVFGLSIAAILLMLSLIERGEVSRMSSLMFLVPPIAVAQAYVLFGEALSGVQLIGMAIAAVGVALTNGGGRPAPAEGCIAANPLDDEDAAKLDGPPQPRPRAV